MKTDTKEKIINYVKENNQATAHELVQWLGISNVAVHKHLKSLIEQGTLTKTGRPPKVFYLLGTEIAKDKPENSPFETEQSKFLDENYLHITVNGQIIEGAKGFEYWAKKTNQDQNLPKLAQEYIQIVKTASDMKGPNRLYNGQEKLMSTFDSPYLDHLFYIDFYALPKFGKTKLGQLMLYAKQSQNRELVRNILSIVEEPIQKFIRQESFDAVAFVPPSIPRKIQFMKEFESQLALSLPVIPLVKAYPTTTIVAQKTLNKLPERIENASSTIFAERRTTWSKLLLIDDAVGSGATMNETAHKLKNRNSVETCTIVGLALTGSYKGFEVVREA